jgi:hypothetical protein
MVSYSRREMITQAFWCWFESRVSLCKIYGDQSGTGANCHATIVPYLCLTAFRGVRWLVSCSTLSQSWSSNSNFVHDPSLG